MSTQDLFSIQSPVLPPTIRVLAFKGDEELSRPYEFEIFLLMSSEDSADFDLDAALDARATLCLHRADGTPRTVFHGIFSAVELLHELPGDALYRAVLVPQFWQLTQTFHSQVF